LSNIIFDLKQETIGFNDEEINQYILRHELLNEVNSGYNPDDDEELKQMFERSERVVVDLAEPGEVKRKDRLAFYTDTYEEYEKIRDFFKTEKRGELDKDKLIYFIK
jgi:hypothetical protein